MATVDGVRERGVGPPAARRDDRREPGPHRRGARRPRGAGRRRERAPVDLPRARRRGRAAGARAARRRGRQGRPGRHLGAELSGVDIPAVRDGAGRRDPRQRQPRVPGARARPRPAPVGRRACSWPRPRSATPTTPRWSTRSRRAVPALSRTVYIGTPSWDELLASAGERRCRRRWPTARPPSSFDDPINIQYTQRHDRPAQGRHAEPPQHPQQRLLRRRDLRLHARRPGLRAGAALPLLRHGHGQPRLHHARRDDRAAGAGVRPGDDAAGRPGRAVHLAVRRADDVHRRARSTRRSRPSTCPACAPGSWPARRARSRS